MTRLIDADSIQWDVEGVGEIPVITKEEIDQMPTVDAVPVKHGKWIPKMIIIGGCDHFYGTKCSECGNDALNAEGNDFLTDYCPYCGARMVEE